MVEGSFSQDFGRLVRGEATADDSADVCRECLEVDRDDPHLLEIDEQQLAVAVDERREGAAEGRRVRWQ